MRSLLVNGKDILEYGATLLSIDYGYAKVTTYKDWLREAKAPQFYEQNEQYSTATIKVVVEAANNVELDVKCSNLVKAFEHAIVKETNAQFYIDGTLNSATDNNINGKAREITLEIEGVKYSERDLKIHAFAGATDVWEFDINGNVETTCYIKIVPDMGYLNMNLEINGEVFTIKNIDSNVNAIIIDGENGMILEDGENKIEDFDAWKFPTLKPHNTIKVNGYPTVSISYNGRWM